MTDWTFNDTALAESFDDHVREQLPWYETATAATASVVRQYVPRNGVIYDLGASTGNIGRALQDILWERDAQLEAIEASEAMAAKYRGPGRLTVGDLREVSISPFDVAVAFLTFMFIAPHEQHCQIERWLNHARPGGALVLVERTTPAGGYPSLVLSRMTLEAKRKAGADSRAILDKEVSLAGVQRPLDTQHLTSLGAVEFFRFADFGGYVIEARP